MKNREHNEFVILPYFPEFCDMQPVNRLHVLKSITLPHKQVNPCVESLDIPGPVRPIPSS